MKKSDPDTLKLLAAVLIFAAIVLIATWCAIPVKAACTPVPTCATPTSTNCATPTPVLQWNRVPDVPTSYVFGYRLYWDYPGGTPQTLVDVPCYPAFTDRAGVFHPQRCAGVDWPYPIQRATSVELDTVEFFVKAYTVNGLFSEQFSNVQIICPSHVWVYPEPYQ